MTPAHHFRLIDTYPCPQDVAAQIVMCLQTAPAQSIYRGDDARHLLNPHGHHSQYQIFHATPRQKAEWDVLGTPNRPGTSSHELKSDGVVYPDIPIGHDLPTWGQGFDVLAQDADEVIRQAALRGWELFRPYSSGAERHHLNFKFEPGPNSRGRIHVTEHHLIVVRNRLPTH